MSYIVTGLVPTADQQRRINQRTWVLLYLAVLGISAVMGLVTIRTTPAPFAVPVTMLMIASGVVAVRPDAGLYIIGFLTLFSDSSISPWYPFAKNLSSHESILFLSDAISISPLEIVLVVTAVSWLLRLVIDRNATTLVRGLLLRPLMLFGVFLFAGLVFGLGTGGDRYVALWEFRPFLYLPLIYVLLTNLFTTRRQYLRLAAVMVAALVCHALLALKVLARLSAEERDARESLVDHGSAVQMSIILIVVLAAWLLPKAPRAFRWVVTLAAIPVGWVWLVSQRRAAVIGLAVSIIVLGIVLAKLNPRRLRKVGPVFVVLAVGYLGAFWHSQGSLGFPAQALKTVIAPEEISVKDRTSDQYRVLENIDIVATIHARPISGFGFGQKFLRPAPLPDISFFTFYEYIPHNSFLWIWIKAGIGGFLAMLYLFGSAIRFGVRAVLRLSRGRDVLLAFAATSYLVMYLVFAYVDIAWDTRNMVTLAVAMAVCSEFLRLPAGTAAPRRLSPAIRARQVALAGQAH